MKFRGRRFQYSLASLLIAMVVLAVILSAWDFFTFEPYTHRFSLYEKAAGTFSDRIDIGPNAASMGLVSRNDRDGTIQHTDGRGHALKNRTAKNEQPLVNAASWLDVVQIELAPTPDRLDIIEARIFELSTHQLISQASPAYGWRVVAPDVVQIYGLGKHLPPKMDVWLRLHSYDENDAVTTLATAVGSTCALPGGTLKLIDIRDGDWNYLGNAGLQSPAGGVGQGTTLEIEWSGAWQGTDYQIAAVAKNGQKYHTESFHFFRPGATDRRPVSFDMPLSEIDHFELRPFGGRHRFYFGAVELPRVSSGAFGQPPIVNVKVGGNEVDATLAQYAPLEVQVRTHRGDWANGVVGQHGRSYVTRDPDGPTDVDQSFTLDYRVESVGLPAIRFKRKSAAAFENESAFKPSGSGTTDTVGYHDYVTPLEEIEAVEVTLRPH